jgi:hypothetical protein
MQKLSFYRINFKKVKICLIVIFLFITFFQNHCAENEIMAPEQSTISIETILKAGPEEAAILPHNSAATFTWDGVIQPGEIVAFSYSLDKILGNSLFNFSKDKALVRSFSKYNLQEGDYIFSVFAHAEYGDSSYTDDTPAIRHFSVVADSLAPVITILRGPEEGATFPSATSIFFEWTAVDPSPAGEIVSYSFALVDQSIGESEVLWSRPRLETTQMAYYKLEGNSYRFWLKATDISRLSTVVSRSFVINE